MFSSYDDQFSRRVILWSSSMLLFSSVSWFFQVFSTWSYPLVFFVWCICYIYTHSHEYVLFKYRYSTWLDCEQWTCSEHGFLQCTGIKEHSIQSLEIQSGTLVVSNPFLVLRQKSSRRSGWSKKICFQKRDRILGRHRPRDHNPSGNEADCDWVHCNI